MCGIVGVMSFGPSGAVDAPTLSRMRDAMRHRGPDGGANWFSSDGKVAFGHRRLSIIDLSDTANQPMADAAANICLTYNGEVYNHAPLRAELTAAGRPFKTDHSDTEVVLQGYAHWGIDGLVDRIAGDYGFAIWDGKLEKLFLVRDRIGVKPLYFALVGDRLLFASEIKAIVEHPAVRREIEPIAAYHYLSFLTTPAPLTMFRGIYKLPAGHYLEVSRNGSLRAVRYWDALPGRTGVGADIRGMSAAAREDYFVRGTRERLTTAVERRMMSDVPFGVFLSGGIDSSTNVALMARFTDAPLRTFTVGFTDFKHLNELDEARLVAREFGTDHHEILIEQRDMIGYLDQLIHHQDEPIADWVCVPLYFVSKLAHDSGVTVVQVGEGSDEQFSGYASYMEYLRLYRQYWSPFRTYLPKPLQSLAAAAARTAASFRPGIKLYADIIDRAARDREHFWSGATVFWDLQKRDLIDAARIHASPELQRIIDAGLLPASYLVADTFNVVGAFYDRIDKEAPGSDVLTRMIYSEFKLRLPELLLMRVDKIGMSVSLEARVPFLDHDLVEFTMDMPMTDKVPGNAAKHILKKAVRGLIPDAIIDRKKMGFGAPMSDWMRGPFGGEVETTLLSSRLFQVLPFDTAHIRWLIAEHRAARRDHALFLWTLFNLAAWYDYWIDRPLAARAA
jgi:asparagine synthase (glutamine-hydrolysing)